MPPIRIVDANPPRTLCLAALAVVAWVAVAEGAEPSPSPEAKALGYLTAEVPRWSRENHCFSCHNNGDAAQALYAALRGSESLPAAALADTNRWLADPGRWDHNGGEGVFSDKRLARLQFAAALAAAVSAGQVGDRGALVRAAGQLASDQEPGGAFSLEGRDALGSPATYGRSIATRVLRDTLLAADRTRFRPAIDRAERWLSSLPVVSLLDAAAVLPIVSTPEAAARPGWEAQRRRCLDLIRRGQSTDGGWGPYASSPPEPFDTAVVVLALVQAAAADTTRDEPDLRDLIRRGRGFLIASQNEDGSWPETTRPAGAESYAQRLSTAGWATRALLATREASSSSPRRAADPER
jgi:hypothetical protein